MSKCPSIARLVSTGQLTLFACQSKKRKGRRNASNGADESSREGELCDTLAIHASVFEGGGKCYSRDEVLSLNELGEDTDTLEHSSYGVITEFLQIKDPG